MDIMSALKSADSVRGTLKAGSVERWKKMEHVKRDLEIFLNFNLVKICFKAKDGKFHEVVGTMNRGFICAFSSTVPELKQKFKSMKSEVVHSQDKHSVFIWDIIDRKQKTIALTDWQILDFIEVSKDNILLLDAALQELLKGH